MRFLIHNYSTSVSSEPLYLFQALKHAGVDVQLWADPNMSAYDAFDRVQPDVFVSSYMYINDQIVEYLLKSKKIKVMLNVTGATETQIQNIKSTFTGIELSVFTNSFSNVFVGAETMYPAFDIFNGPQPVLEIPDKLENAILCEEISEKVEELISQKDVYHILYIGEGDKPAGFDLRVDIRSIKKILSLYKNVTLVGSNELCSSQVFLDMSMYADNFSVIAEDQDLFYSKCLTTLFDNKNVDETKKLDEQIKTQIKSKHTPFHRAARLAKLAGDKESLSKIEKVKQQILSGV